MARKPHPADGVGELTEIMALAGSRQRASKKSAITSPSAHKINLKAVADALIDAGLDPAVEITRVLKGSLVFDDDGQPVMDPATGEQKRQYSVDTDTRLRTLNEILQYTQPKLKAVEVKLNGSLELTSDQLDQRLGALLEKAAR